MLWQWRYQAYAYIFGYLFVLCTLWLFRTYDAVFTDAVFNDKI